MMIIIKIIGLSILILGFYFLIDGFVKAHRQYKQKKARAAAWKELKESFDKIKEKSFKRNKI